MIIVAIEHIVIDDKGNARIKNSRIKVIDLVIDRKVHGWTLEKIQEQHPHLSLAQIHAAFAYYYDHQEELDRQIENDFEEAEAMRIKAGESPLAKKLRASRE